MPRPAASYVENDKLRSTEIVREFAYQQLRGVDTSSGSTDNNDIFMHSGSAKLWYPCCSISHDGDYEKRVEGWSPIRPQLHLKTIVYHSQLKPTI
jgi:hypothetical protein